MDYELLRQKVELIIKGLECMNDPESEDDFISLLDNFSERMIKRCKRLKAEDIINLN